jgi:hypothetical protein
MIWTIDDAFHDSQPRGHHVDIPLRRLRTRRVSGHIRSDAEWGSAQGGIVG